MPLTEELAYFVSGLGYTDVPDAAVDVVRTCFIDTVGVLIAGSGEPVVGIVRETLCGSEGDARLLPNEDRIGAPEAALVNGVAAHVLDYDDVALDGHPSAVLVPAILAQADGVGASGCDMITAYVSGYEVWAELHRREADMLHNKGCHPTSIYGCVAAAAACAHLLRLPPERTRNALAISASLAGGLVANFGSMTKSFQVGRAAQSGVIAARLAARGMTGSQDALEHPRGFLVAVSPKGQVEREKPASDLRRVWQIVEQGVSIKKYPTCYATHRSADALLKISRERTIEAGKVEKIVVRLGATQSRILRNLLPQTALEAKFSIEFAVASVLLTGRLGLRELDDEFVCRPEVQSLMSKVERALLPDDHPELPFSRYDEVELTLAGGDKLSARVEEARGGAHNPLSADEISAKFNECTARFLSADDAVALLGNLTRLPELASLASLTARRNRQMATSS